MADRDKGVITSALDTFLEARQIIGETFDVISASEVVNKVLQGRAARNGRCPNGFEYMVHGIGYTVIFPTGAQVHIDSCGETRDCFKTYDVRFYLDDIADEAVSLEAIADACDAYTQSGLLRRIDEVTFEIVEP